MNINPGHKLALAKRANGYLKLGEYDLALVDANECLKDNNDYLKVNRFESFLQLNHLLFMLI